MDCTIEGLTQQCRMLISTQVITINNLHSAVNFNWRDSISSHKFNHSMLLKATSECLVQASISHAKATQPFRTATFCQLE
jgi:hypothetical protein